MQNQIAEAPLLKKNNDLVKAELAPMHQNDKEMQEGLYYASTIQQALFPQERHFKRHFDDYFILHCPQQILGGDFYWLGQKDDWIYFSVADCTGHGVSGALLSVLGIGFLNYLVHSKSFNSLGEILQEMDKKWIEAFDNGNDSGFDNDWVEMSILAFNPKTRKLKFSSANTNAICVFNNEIVILEGDKYPIGGWQLEKNRTFSEQEFSVPPESTVYLGSDGFRHQFGGPQLKKFSFKRICNLIEENHHLPLSKQKIIFERAFLEWKGFTPQIDDVCVFGVRL